MYDKFKLLIRIFKDLDENNLVFSHNNSPSDFVKSHIITDGRRKIVLCNKHLLKCVKRKQRQARYTSRLWIKRVIKSLFPRADKHKTVPTNIPTWAIDILKDSLKSSSSS